MLNSQESLKSLFQREFSKLVAVISRRFGLQHVELAEDIVSETFLQAAETWGVRGLPNNPAGWLGAVAKQKMLSQLRRRRLLKETVLPQFVASGAGADAEDFLDFDPQVIRDSQLQMLFAVCTPLIPREAQIGLALRILCGFGIDEIAEAFLTTKDTVNKRLFRAKEKLRAAQVSMVLPAEPELVHRLDQVLRVIYLLFNEGYQSKTNSQALQKELCLEAMRLAVMLTEYAGTNQPKTQALLALMCFHASRFDARSAGHCGDTARHATPRQASAGETYAGRLLLYEQQDDALWDAALIRQGFAYLQQSLAGSELSPYHLEARIASWHCTREDTPEKWAAILALYDQLRVINPSPSVALNQTYALYKVKGQRVALVAAEALALKTNHHYFVLLGELHKESDPGRAAAHFQQAHDLARTPADRQAIREKMNAVRREALGQCIDYRRGR